MELYDQIIETYKETGSVKETAEKLGTYPIKVRRVLITEGLWRSKTSDAIGELYRQGRTTKEIAAELYMSEKNVQSYLPYARGMYGGEKSDDAIRSEQYRERNRNTFESQVVHQQQLDEGKEIHEMGNGVILDLDKYRDAKPKQRDSQSERDNRTRKILDLTTDLDVLKLRLELVNYYETEEETEILRRYGKAENGIIREVLIPGRMPLHAVHFMIQRLFGWRNSHLHHFELPKPVFEGLTADSASAWVDLCGVYFRFPEGNDYSDVYWDDDYDESISVKTWYRRKYSDGNWDTFSVGDCYLDNLRKVQEFETWVNEDERAKEIFKGRTFAELSMDDLMLIPDIGMEANHLAERLEIGDLLYVKGKGGKREKLGNCREGIAYLIEEYNEILQDEFDEDELDYYAEAAKRLRTLRSNYQEIDRITHFDPLRARKELGKDPLELKLEYEWAIEEMQSECLEYINDWNPDIIQVSDELSYCYDYGDGWEVKITCVEGYHADWENDDFDYASAEKHEIMEHLMTFDEEAVYFDSSNNKVPDDLQNTLEEIFYLQKPICIYADGLNVMDDVGGYGGYIDFLETIHGADKEAAKDMRDWARWMGWTGRKSKPENML